MQPTLTRRQLLALVPALAAASAAGPLYAAQANGYPDKPIRAIVPFPAGSGTDNTARYLTQVIASRIGQPIVVDNRPGASGFLAARAVATAAPDGYTMLITTNTTHAANASLFKELPYDPIKDFAPISLVAKSSLVLVVPADSPVRTVADLTALAKEKKGQLSFASGSSSTRVASELYKIMSGVDALHVPYRGVPQALADLMGHQVDFMMSDLSPATPLIESGKLRAIAVSSAQRDPLLKDIPTMAENGLSGYELQAWVAAFFPAGTPEPIVAQMNQLMRETLALPETAEQLGRTGIVPVSSTPQDLGDFVDSETRKWAEVIQAAGIEPE